MGFVSFLRSLFAPAGPAQSPPAAIVTHPPGGPSPDSEPIVKSHGVITTSTGTRPVIFLPGTGRGYFLEVKGESQYQETLGQQWEKMRPERETSVRLTAEPTNPYDAHAVAVQTFWGDTVGYLSRDDAARYQQLLLQIEARGLIAACGARLVGGTARKQHIGIYLDVEVPTTVAAKLGLIYKRVSSKGAATNPVSSS